MVKNNFFVFSLFFLPLFLFAQTDLRKNPPKKIPTAASKFSGNFIDVNSAAYPQSAYSPEDLVKKVLISSGSACGEPNVSNVTVNPNMAVTNQDRFWGYFNKSTSTFPFADGVILSTGYARTAGNSFITGIQSGTIGSQGDTDLATAVNLNYSSMRDAVMLEFDFVPSSTQIKFNYIVASEEYSGSFACNYADAFALLIKPVGGATYTNLAVLPNGTPVSIQNIHPTNAGCGEANANYYAGNNTANVETNFEGRTIPLTAVGTVVPGQAYHFKLVLADYQDSSYDSAVFLEGGSFDIGVKILDDAGAELPADINVCDNVPTTISSSVDIPNATYKWFKDGVLIPTATTTTLVVTSPGTYKIEVWVPGNNCPGTADITVHGGTTPIANDATYLLCTTPDNLNFNLQQLQPLMSTSPGAVFKFYKTLAAAQAQDNTFITNIYNYPSAGEILYVDVISPTSTFCHKIVKLTLDKEETPTASISSTKMRICAGETVTLKATGGVTYAWDNFGGNGDTQTVTLNQTETFKVYAVNAKGCKSLNPATITIEVLPKITSDVQGVEFCNGDSAVLNPGISGTGLTYLWNTGETTPSITVNEWGEYTLFVDNGLCKQAFTFKAQAAALPVINNLEYNNGKLVVSAISPAENKPLEYSIDGGITWQDSNVFTEVQNNKMIFINVRVKATHCEVSIEFFTYHINNMITPNDDGINDKIDLSNMMNFPGFKAAIYDRYGAPIFNFSQYAPIWDGTVGGKKLSTGTYWMEINWMIGTIPTKNSGWIMLKNR